MKHLKNGVRITRFSMNNIKKISKYLRGFTYNMKESDYSDGYVNVTVDDEIEKLEFQIYKATSSWTKRWVLHLEGIKKNSGEITVDYDKKTECIDILNKLEHGVLKLTIKNGKFINQHLRDII